MLGSIFGLVTGGGIVLGLAYDWYSHPDLRTAARPAPEARLHG